MGFTKTHRKPNEWMIKARVKTQGEDRRKQELFEGTRAGAEERYFDLKRELRGERRESRTFGDLLQTYLDSRGALGRGQASIFKALSRDIGKVDILDLPSALKRYYALLKTMPSDRTGGKRGAAALNRTRQMVAATLNLGIAHKVLPESPLNEAVWPKAKEIPRDRFLSELELQNLLNALPEHLVPVTRFALLVPCRKSELVRMTRADLDLFHNAIRVSNGTTKNDDGAWKPIPPELVPYFRSIPAESPFLFFRKVKGVYRPLGDFKKAWANAKQKAGIRNLHFHDSRHQAATAMVDAGTPERVVMDIAGWRTNMLSTYYKSSSKKALSLVRFPAGGGNNGATSEANGGKSGVNDSERAVS